MIEKDSIEIIFIYILKDPRTNKIRYVGQSKNPEIRLKEHIRKSNMKITYKNNWISGLLKKNFKPLMEIIDQTSKQDADKMETFWIQKLKTSGHPLTNLSMRGGGGNHGKEANQKISEKLKGRKISQITRENMSKAAKKRHIDYPITDITRKKMSKKKQGPKNSMYGKNRSINPARHTEIYQIDLNDNIIKKWFSISKAAKSLELHRSGISGAVFNRQKTAGGFKWKKV